MTAKLPSSSVPLDDAQFAGIARVLADPRRFAMLQQIAAANAMPCSALNQQHIISRATISHHLKELQASGLIEAEREGRTMRLSFRRDVWNAYLQRLASL